MASWRSGYAADCKAPHLSPDIKKIPQKPYQDIARTQSEPDTASICRQTALKSENPGALAGATGTIQENGGFQSAEYHLRLERAKSLAFAIGECHPDDAVLIMAAALDDLRPGQPIAAFQSLMIEANSWAAFATRNELKCYAVAAFNAMRSVDQAAFLAHVRGGE